MSASPLVGLEDDRTRVILLRPSCFEKLKHGGGDSRVTRTVRSKMRVQIERFLNGEQLIAFVDMKPLKPEAYGVWELRFRFHPHCRILGFFVQRDAFVGVDIFVHSDLDRRDDVTGELGWDAAKSAVRQAASEFAANITVMTSPYCSDVVSNCTDRALE